MENKEEKKEVPEKMQQEVRQEAPAAGEEKPGQQVPGAEHPEFEAHIRSLEEQALALQEKFPDFDLARELSNPVFLQLTAPGTGISVEDAYYALHRKEIQQREARITAQKVVSAIQSGSRRPLEAGTSGQAPSLTTFHYGSATREQRDAFKKELRRAWGRGETVYPGR